MTVSPTLTSSGTRWPLSSIRPGPMARTVPSCGFSLAVSGITMPEAVVCSASLACTRIRSSSGLIATLVAVVTCGLPFPGVCLSKASTWATCRRGSQGPRRTVTLALSGAECQSRWRPGNRQPGVARTALAVDDQDEPGVRRDQQQTNRTADPATARDDQQEEGQRGR